jgi:hypothetical protein
MAEFGVEQHPYQFGIAYERPRDTDCVKYLKAIIQEGQACVSSPLCQSLSDNVPTGT